MCSCFDYLLCVRYVIRQICRFPLFFCFAITLGKYLVGTVALSGRKGGTGEMGQDPRTWHLK